MTNLTSMRAKVRRIVRVMPQAAAAAFDEALSASKADSEARRELLGIEAVNMATYEARPAIPVMLFIMSADHVVLRGAIHEFWTGIHHREFLREIQNAGTTLHHLLRAARFEVPDAFPTMVTVYRGARCGLYQTRNGNSWTLNRATASYFAVSHLLDPSLPARVQDRPMVVTRKVPRSALLFCSRPHPLRADLEEVIFDAPPAGRRDGHEAEWLRLGGAWFRAWCQVPWAFASLHKNAHDRAVAAGIPFVPPERPALTDEDVAVLGPETMRRIHAAARAGTQELAERALERWGSVENVRHAYHEARLAGLVS